MSLSDLIKKHYVVGILGLALASCGDERTETPTPCQSDVECKGDRVCVEGYCKDSAGDDVTEDDNSTDACADSPLTGKYLWNISHCYEGSKTPFQNCRGRMGYYTDFGEVREPEIEVRYDGLTIYSGERRMELVKEFSLADINPRGATCYDDYIRSFGEEGLQTLVEGDHRLIHCVLSNHPELYYSKINGEVCNDEFNSDFYQIRTMPWPGKEECYNELRDFPDHLFDGCE